MATGVDRAPVVLDRDDCERRLRASYTGRVGFVDDGRPQVLPVNYAFADGVVVFKTGPGAKLDAALRQDVVAFEVDAVDVDAHAGWSVQVVGRARVLGDPEEIAWARSLPLRTWAFGGDRPFWVVVDLTEVTGRIFG